MARNPFESIDDKPITRSQVEDLRQTLCKYWEDTWLVTNPNREKIIEIGNLRACLDTLLNNIELK